MPQRRLRRHRRQRVRSPAQHDDELRNVRRRVRERQRHDSLRFGFLFTHMLRRLRELRRQRRQRLRAEHQYADRLWRVRRRLQPGECIRNMRRRLVHARHVQRRFRQLRRQRLERVRNEHRRGPLELWDLRNDLHECSWDHHVHHGRVRADLLDRFRQL